MSQVLSDESVHEKESATWYAHWHAVPEEPSPGYHEIPVHQERVRATHGSMNRYLRYRAALDRAVAATLLLLVSPLLVVLYVAVKISSRGPAFYTQCRSGYRGKVFKMYKFRSMYCDAEERTGPVWSQPGDPRVTPVGVFLRWSHLDELPQLLNILNGEMSLVGPRPERPEFVEQLEKKVPGYRDRLEVLPGVTGLAQVSLPADSNLEGVRRKTMLDRKYVQSASLWLDIHILFCTAMMLFGLQRRLDVRVWNCSIS